MLFIMIPLYSTQQIRKVDEYAIKELKIPSIVLMENASRSMFQIISENINDNIKTFGFLCGKGNNGGDGFALARHLANYGYAVKVLHLGSENDLSEDCQTNFKILKKLALENKNITIFKFQKTADINKLKNCDVIVDALLGSGAKGDLREPYKKIVEKVNSFNSFKIAVDIPTGLDADTGYGASVFNSDLTITLGDYKKGLFFEDGYNYGGQIKSGNIGVPASYYEKYFTEDYLIEPEDVYNSLPEKNKNIHKYSAGKVLTIAGSGKLPGAAAMTSKSALKIGAGSSILSFPNSVRNLIQKKLDEVIVEPYEGLDFLTEENIPEISERLKWADVTAIGPGLGREEETQIAVRKIIKKRLCKKMIIDADAVFALSNEHYKKLNLSNFILTPHHGEFSNLLGIKTTQLKKDILSYGKSFVKETKAYLVLKGAPTIIFTPDGDALVNTTGNPGMAKFGTGDVLTGVLAGLISQQKDLEKAIVAGVYLHSLASDLLVKKYTEYGYTAYNIMNNLPNAIKFIRNTFD